LSNKNVGVIFGSTAEDTIKFLLPTAHVLGYKTYSEAYRALKNGTVLGITSDDAILRSYSMSDPTVELLPKRYSRDSYAIAFRRGTESDYILEVVNHLITDMDSRGVFMQLKRKWGLD
jgi:putative glutamine transport system substrate-binding protein